MNISSQSVNFPQPAIIQRSVNTEDYQFYCEQGLSDIQSRVLSARRPQEIDPKHILHPEQVMIPEPLLLSGMQLASSALADYLLNDNRPIVLSTDFDVDGISSAAILKSVLSNGVLDFNNNNVIPIISNRLNDGYGFTNKVVDQILAMDVTPGVVITADHGSSNGKQITRLVSEINKRGEDIKVIVTDHHSIPEGGGPKDAYAFINPNQGGDCYPDKTICGATVAWLLLLATVNELKARDVLDASVSIDDMLDYACAATIADCVSIASPANRYIIKNGLAKMNQQTRPAWTAFKDIMGTPYQGITSDTIGFQLGPKINANSRMGFDGNYALEFLTADSVYEAKKNLSTLNINNDDRKQVETDMLQGALIKASLQYEEGQRGLSVYMPDGMHSVHGIVASRIVEKFGCPTMCISPKEKGIVSASLRSIVGVDIKQVLDNIQQERQLFIGYGGHTMAAGCSFYEEDLGLVQLLFNNEVVKQTNAQPKPIIYTDEFTGSVLLNLDAVDHINALEPYGREFEYPQFSCDCEVLNIYPIGKDKTHAKLELLIDGQGVEGVWFKARRDASSDFSVKQGDNTQVVFSIKDNFFNGQRKLQLMVNGFV